MSNKSLSQSDDPVGRAAFKLQMQWISSLSFFLHFRNSSVATRDGQQRNFCGQKEPFAFLVLGSYAHVRLYSYYYHQTTLKTFYVVMDNGKLTVTLI